MSQSNSSPSPLLSGQTQPSAQPLVEDTSLISDALSLLCLLHADDVRPFGTRFLPPTALTKLAQYLCVPEPVLSGQSKASYLNHPWRKERDTHRIRLVHFLCEAAGLIAITSGCIKPTPRVSGWLAESNQARLCQLVLPLMHAALAKPTAKTNEAFMRLWQAYRLPGWQFSQPLLALQRTLLTLRKAHQQQPTAWVSGVVLANGIPVPFEDMSDEDTANAQPDAVLSNLLLVMRWCGLIEQRENNDARLTSLAVWLVTHSPASASPASPLNPVVPRKTDGGFDLVTSDDSLLFVVKPHTPWAQVYEMSTYADLVSITPTRAYQLNRTRVEQAFQCDGTRTFLLNFFEQALGGDLPQVLCETLQHWWDACNQVVLRRVTLLETRDADTFTQLAHSRGTRTCLARTLSPRVAVVKDDQVAVLLRRLSWRGLSPRIGFPHSASLPATRSQANAACQSLDQSTRFHLYLSAQLGHHLPDLVPLSYRTPHAVIEVLERGMSAQDIDLVRQMVADQVAALTQAKQAAAEAAASITDSTPTALLARVRTLIDRAIETRTAVQITYFSPQHDAETEGITTRVIEPIRIEHNEPWVYIIAFCQLARAERTFRLDRIREITPVLPASTTSS